MSYKLLIHQDQARYIDFLWVFDAEGSTINGL